MPDRSAAPTARREQAAKRRPPIATLVAVILGVGVVIAGALVVTAGDDDGEAGLSNGGAVVSHVHGLGVNPANQALYAATHHGVFRIPREGAAEPVGPPRDTMGFTVAGPDRFLGSGHPAFRGDPLFEQGTPPLLGLIESADGGQTWEPRSLYGEVDFHSLRAAHDQVYGYDATSSRFLVSADGVDWDARSTVLLFDFAVDPEDGDHIVATGDDGLTESLDGGRTWTSADGPPLVFVAWHESRGLWGVDRDGAVHVRAVAGWEERAALPGQPQALLVTDDAVYAAAVADDRTGIYVSDDDGDSWRLRYQDPEQ